MPAIAHQNKILGDDIQSIHWSQAKTSVKKNLLPITLAEVKANNTSGSWNNNVYTLNSVALTFTVNERGYVTQISANGTAGANTYIKLCNAISLERTQYRLSGNSFPTGSCALYAENHSTGATSTPWANYNNVDSVLDVTSDNYTSAFWLSITSGTALSNQIIKPMLRDASILDNTYVPFIYDNTELVSYKDNAITGVHNFIPTTAVSQVNNGITYTVNSDGSITANGTATADSYLTISSNAKIPKGTYILTGGKSANVFMYLTDVTNITYDYRYDRGTGIQFTANADVTTSLALCVKSGQTLSNMTIYPLVRLATDTDDTYVPYAMTNRELTEKAVEVDNILPKVIDAGQIDANSSKSFACTNYYIYRLTLASLGSQNQGKVVIFGKHPSVSNAVYAEIDALNMPYNTPTVSASGANVTVTTTTANTQYILERIK